MNVGLVVGLSVGCVGLFIALVGLIFDLTAKSLLENPPKYDGVGGQDTSNLMGGCLGLVLGRFAIIGGGIILLFGLIISGIAALIGVT